MDVRHLRHFLAVAEALNYSRAAERLMMAASPLSRSIQQLELEIGGALFVRGTRKVALTPLGIALVPHAEKTIADMDALRREMNKRLQGFAEYYVGIRSVPSELITGLIGVVKRVDPSASVRLESLDSFAQMDRLINGKLTFGLVNRRVDDRRLDYWEVLRETPALALPNRPEYAELEEVRPENLRGLRLLLQPGTAPFGSEFDPYRETVTELVPVETEIIGGLSAMIAAGDSCCFTMASPKSPWYKYLAGDDVIIRPLADSPKSSTYLVWRSDRDTENDLGPTISAARDYFDQPVEN
ncbi:LysR family transcriptional regulator [Subtercola endophyticus]|uniref:LysR family transcriptional regulator n=1 Tax=Subtercola endophyticus TaxID=2895559 RepID=UPI001E5F26FF|nr:LysR family transcriptional regulator [Subtercola endophyticus]UFS58757.1 LysR family transcriptional regulator [Subtercola endophyticus]